MLQYIFVVIGSQVWLFIIQPENYFVNPEQDYLGEGKRKRSQINWKNCSEDIWFFSLKNKSKFNIEQVKIKRKVLAPYKDTAGNPKDWDESENGNFRITYPSNLWTDITVPFWSMSEIGPSYTKT